MLKKGSMSVVLTIGKYILRPKHSFHHRAKTNKKLIKIIFSIQMENFQDYDPLLIEYHHR